MTDDMTLTKDKKNEVAKLIADLNINKSEFKWSRATQPRSLEIVSRLEHKPTGHWFEFGVFDGHPTSYFSPGTNIRKEKTYQRTWDDQKIEVSRWLGRILKESGEPDLWDQATEAARWNIGSAIGDIENKAFDESEQRVIERGVRLLVDHIGTLSLDRDRLSRIEEKLEYLKDAGYRLGRKDWLHILIGILLKIGIDLQARGEELQQLFEVASGAFASLFQGLLPS